MSPPVPIRPAFRPLLPKPPDTRSAPVCELSISKKPLTKRSHKHRSDSSASSVSSSSSSTSSSTPHSAKKKRISSEPPSSSIAFSSLHGLPSTIAPSSLMTGKNGASSKGAHSRTVNGSSSGSRHTQRRHSHKDTTTSAVSGSRASRSSSNSTVTSLPAIGSQKSPSLKRPTLSTTYTTPLTTPGAFRRNTSLMLSMNTLDTPLETPLDTPLDTGDMMSTWEADDIWTMSSPELQLDALDSEESASRGATDDLFSLDAYVSPDTDVETSYVSSILETGISI